MIREHGATPAHQPVERFRDPDHESLHAAREGAIAVCLDH
jgi:hypothetical protein